MNIKENILKICKERGISVYKLEKSAGLSHGYVAKLDKSKPASDKLQKIADFFEIPMERLLNSEDSDKNTSSVQNVEVDEYIGNILCKLRNPSSNAGVMYLKGTKLTDTQIELLADDLENALNRVIKLSERRKSEE